MANRAQQALQFFTSALGLTPAQAAGLVGNLQQESGAGLNPAALGDNGASFGIAQWNRPAGRLPQLQQFAKARGSSSSDFQTQLAFLAHELQTTEKSAFDRLRSTKTPAEAAEAAVTFFRPGDPQTKNRIANAVALAGGDPVSGDARFGNPQAQPQQPQGLLSLFAGQDRMANGPRGILDTLARGNPLMDLGTGILMASGSPVGRSIGEALGFVGERGRARMENDIVRQKLLQQNQQQQAVQQLQGLLSGGGNVADLANNPAVIGLLGQIAPEAVASGLLGQVFQNPDGLEQKLGTVQSAIGRPLTEEEVIKLAGGGTTINIGDKLNGPISVDDLGKLRMPDGKPLPLGTTLGQAQEAGAVVLSADEQKALKSVDSATAVVSQLEGLALGIGGEGGIFSGVESGFFNRAKASIENLIDVLDQDDPKVSQYTDLAKGTLSSLGRIFGSTGALSDTDIARMEGLVPRVFPLPDTREVAAAKLKDLNALINRGFENLQKNAEPPVSTGVGESPASDTSATTTPSGSRVNRIRTMLLPDIQRLNPADLSEEELRAAIERATELAQ